MTDEELIEETEKTSIEIRELGDLIWELILKYEKRAHVLQLVEQDYQNGTKSLYDFIDGLAQIHAGEMIANSRNWHCPSLVPIRGGRGGTTIDDDVGR